MYSLLVLLSTIIKHKATQVELLTKFNFNK
jgi:hypothetical protein